MGESTTDYAQQCTPMHGLIYKLSLVVVVPVPLKNFLQVFYHPGEMCCLLSHTRYIYVDYGSMVWAVLPDSRRLEEIYDQRLDLFSMSV